MRPFKLTAWAAGCNLCKTGEHHYQYSYSTQDLPAWMATMATHLRSGGGLKAGSWVDRYNRVTIKVENP